MIKVSSLINSANFKPLVLDGNVQESRKGHLPDQNEIGKKISGHNFNTVLKLTRNTK